MPLGGLGVVGDDRVGKHLDGVVVAAGDDQRRRVGQPDGGPRPRRHGQVQRRGGPGVQGPVGQADAAGLPVQRAGIPMRGSQRVDVVVTAGHPPQPGIRHGRGGGGDLGENAQRAGGVTAAVGIHGCVKRPALLGGRGHRGAIAPGLSGGSSTGPTVVGSGGPSSSAGGGPPASVIGTSATGSSNADGSRCVRT